MERKIWLLLIVVFICAAFLRLWRLTEIPPGFTPDEAAQGYTAYSILKTGRDEWGVKFPLNPRSFGDFKPPLQTYLIIPSIAIFGLNEFAVRFPNALLGSLAILGIFLLAKELFASWMIGLFSAALLAFSPWHLPLSRGAFEANLTVFFTSFGIYFLLKMFKEKHWYWQVLAALFLGLNLFSYHSAKLITPVVVLLYFGARIMNSELRNRKPKTYYSLFTIQYSVFSMLFLTLFLVAYSSFLSGGQTRGLDIAVFHPTDNWQTVKTERWWTVKSGLPDFVARIFHNKLSYSLSQFSKNYLSYLSPQFLFFEGPGEGTYGMIPGRGVLWWWELPILLFGIYQLVKKPSKKVLLIVFIILLAPIPAALTKGIRAANRAAVMMPWVQMLTAVSIWQLINKFISGEIVKSEKLKVKPIFAIPVLGIPIFLFASFLEDYFVLSPQKISRAMLYGRCQAIRYASQYQDKVEQIVVSRKLSEPQAYVMFCLKYPPELAQEEASDWLEYQEKGLGFVDQLGEYRLGQYWFKEINWPSDSKLTNAILIGRPEEFPGNIKPDKIIYYPDGEKGILIIKTEKNGKE